MMAKASGNVHRMRLCKLRNINSKVSQVMVKSSSGMRMLTVNLWKSTGL